MALSGMKYYKKSVRTKQEVKFFRK